MTQKDLKYSARDNWLIVINAHDADGAVLPLLSGSEVWFRLSDEDGVKIVKSVGDGFEITDDEGGVAQIFISLADQAEAGLSYDKVYVYEIRTIVDLDESVQAEGQFRIEHSLFTTPAAGSLLIEFQTRFPEFTEDDSTIALYIADASRVIADDGNWLVQDIPSATVYLAAHYLQLRRMAAAALATGNLMLAGPVRTITVEGRSIGFGNTNSNSGSSGNSTISLGKTQYGMRYLAMKRRNPVFIRRA
jgi:hypothetical protein